MSDSPSVVVADFADRRPIWRMPDWAAADLRSGLPPGWELRVVDAPVDGTGDGGGPASPAAVEAVRDAEAYLGFGVSREVLAAGSRLRWVHTGTGGVGEGLAAATADRGLLLTNSAGVHGPPVAETAMAMILHFARGLDIAVRAQREGRWDRSPFDSAAMPVREVAGSVVGVVGYGGIGTELGARALAMGARVLGVRSGSARGAARRGAADSAAVEVVRGRPGLERVLRESHFVVLSLPETEATRGLIGRGELALMRGDSVLINVARGALLHEAALVDALRAGAIRGAGLDVFATEPLPAGHPLWALPNVLVTPHISAYSHDYWDRELALILDNLARLAEGSPLRNVVDPVAGY